MMLLHYRRRSSAFKSTTTHRSSPFSTGSRRSGRMEGSRRLYGTPDSGERFYLYRCSPPRAHSRTPKVQHPLPRHRREGHQALGPNQHRRRYCFRSRGSPMVHLACHRRRRSWRHSADHRSDERLARISFVWSVCGGEARLEGDFSGELI